MECGCGRGMCLLSGWGQHCLITPVWACGVVAAAGLVRKHIHFGFGGVRTLAVFEESPRGYVHPYDFFHHPSLFWRMVIGVQGELVLGVVFIPRAAGD